MQMKPHAKATYKDGYKNVEYCKVCGSEDQDLLLDCPGERKDETQLDFFTDKLDKAEEQI